MTAKILLVDDNAANISALQAVLDPLDRPLVSAASGEEALMCVLSSTFAVILLDVKMQGMDGFETAAMIHKRERSREIPIIFITGYEETVKDIQRAYDVGAFDFITKPFNPDILRHKIAAFVRLFEQAEALNEAQEDARLRDVFVGILGHDLRSPLGAITMAAAVLGRAQDIPERHRRTIDGIARSSSRMQRLISDILDFTRGRRGGGIPIVPEDVQLHEICRQAVDELQVAHPNRSISCEANGTTEGHWDPSRLAQVISNLVANAIQHATVGPIRVSVDGTHEADVTLTVTNSGVIPREVLPRLFEPFHRGDNSAAGLGLGLYIVCEIVRAHSGHVRVRPHLDTGETQFVVSLPRRPHLPKIIVPST